MAKMTCPKCSGSGRPGPGEMKLEACSECGGMMWVEAPEPRTDRATVFGERYGREVAAKKQLAEQVLEAGRKVSTILSDREIAQLLRKIADGVETGRLRPGG